MKRLQDRDIPPSAFLKRSAWIHSPVRPHPRKRDLSHVWADDRLVRHFCAQGNACADTRAHQPRREYDHAKRRRRCTLCRTRHLSKNRRHRVRPLICQARRIADTRDEGRSLATPGRV